MGSKPSNDPTLDVVTWYFQGTRAIAHAVPGNRAGGTATSLCGVEVDAVTVAAKDKAVVCARCEQEIFRLNHDTLFSPTLAKTELKRLSDIFTTRRHASLAWALGHVRTDTSEHMKQDLESCKLSALEIQHSINQCVTRRGGSAAVQEIWES